MKKLYLLLFVQALLIVTWLLLWGCRTGWAEHPKNWILEDEFSDNGELRARPEHTVVLRLERGSSKVRNSIPYIFEDRGRYNFCIDEDDPLIDSMKLVNARGVTVARVNKKKRCVERTIPEGRYTMHVYHDGEAVQAELQHAFVHQRKAPLPVGKNNPWAGTPEAVFQEESPRSGDAEKVGDPLPSSGYWTVEAGNGKTLRSRVLQQGSDQIVTTGDTSIPILRFAFEHPGFGEFLTFGCQSLGTNAGTCTFGPGYNPSSGFFGFFAKIYYSGCTTGCLTGCYTYFLRDLGNYKFQIGGDMGFFDDERRRCYTVSTCVTDKGGALGVEKSNSPSCNPSGLNVFTLAAINVPAAQVPPDSLQKGQAALYDQPDCSGNATVVMPGNHELEAGAASVRMPHDTRITLYEKGTGKSVVLNGGPVCLNVGPGFVAQSMTVESTPDILLSTKKCRYCDLYGLSLQNMTLDGFDFSYAYLASTQFIKSSMKGVNLSHAVLAGAQLDNANLQGSNMCNAFLQGNVEIITAASLNGAYMKNVNLSGATLSGVSMINTGFYNTGTLPCPASCDSSQMTSTCATAAYATMDGTQATPAYLARTDFSGIKTTGTNFSGSILVGANFSNAQLHTDASSTAATNFDHAFLQGADFSGASVDYVSFRGAYVDLNPQPHLGFQLPGPYTQFNGFWATPGSSICVDNLNPAPTVVPVTTTRSNMCPDGNSGPCSNEAWTSLSTLLDQAVPKTGYGLCPCDVLSRCGDRTWSEY